MKKKFKIGERLQKGAARLIATAIAVYIGSEIISQIGKQLETERQRRLRYLMYALALLLALALTWLFIIMEGVK